MAFVAGVEICFEYGNDLAGVMLFTMYRILIFTHS